MLNKIVQMRLRTMAIFTVSILLFGVASTSFMYHADAMYGSTPGKTLGKEMKNATKTMVKEMKNATKTEKKIAINKMKDTKKAAIKEKKDTKKAAIKEKKDTKKAAIKEKKDTKKAEVSEKTSDAKVSIPKGASSPGCDTTNSCYMPFNVSVSVGGKVTWTNNDTAIHTVTSGKNATSDGTFDSGTTTLTSTGKTFSYTFKKAGSYDYFCMLHPWMKGKVTVS